MELDLKPIELPGIVNETKAFRVYIKYSGFVLEAQYIGKEGAHFTGS